VIEAYEEQDNGSDAKSKVADLSKRNRALQMQLEREKTETNKAKNELAKVKQDAKKAEGRDLEGEIREYKKKVDDGATRLGKTQLEIANLQDRNRKLEALLKAQVGKDADVDKLLKSVGPGGAGVSSPRAAQKNPRQEIEVLKAQVRDLRKKLGETQETTREERDSENLTRGRREREAKELEEAQERAKAAEADLQGMKEKVVAANARGQALTRQIDVLREKLATVLAKTANDDKYIAALRAEVDKLRKGGGGGGGALVAEQEAQITRQEAIIKALNSQIQDLQIQLHHADGFGEGSRGGGRTGRSLEGAGASEEGGGSWPRAAEQSFEEAGAMEEAEEAEALEDGGHEEAEALEDGGHEEAEALEDGGHEEAEALEDGDNGVGPPPTGLPDDKAGEPRD